MVFHIIFLKISTIENFFFFSSNQKGVGGYILLTICTLHFKDGLPTLTTLNSGN